MTPKHIEIITAAKTLFMRYGYGKTTMGEIAQEAGVARQTVYNAFPSKPDIMRAVVRYAGEMLQGQVAEAWSATTGIDEKLQAFHDLVPIHIYEVSMHAPDASEVWEGMHKEAADEIAAQNVRWLEMMTQVFAEAQSEGATAREMAEFFFSASVNAKYGACDLAHLRRRLAVIKSAALALLAEECLAG